MDVGWSDKTKVIPNSTQFKFKLKLKLKLSLAKYVKEAGAELGQAQFSYTLDL